ncbi:hypothetical protein F2Q68_00039871 [Brassica cretica]|nr:hypothetical protein F2Q68_00039871 [Brassica cretica]
MDSEEERNRTGNSFAGLSNLQMRGLNDSMANLMNAGLKQVHQRLDKIQGSQLTRSRTRRDRPQRNNRPARPSQPSRQAKANSRARLDLGREDSQNDHDFSLLVRLARTKCPDDRTDGLSLMSNALLDFYHSDFSKARIIKLSEDLGRISALLDHPADCPDRPRVRPAPYRDGTNLVG